MYNTKGKTILESYKLNKKYADELSLDIEQLTNKRNKIAEKYGTAEIFDKELDRKRELYVEAHELVVKIENAINTLGQPSRNILYYKYIKHMQNIEIAMKMDYSVQRIYQLLNIAINEFSKIFNEQKSENLYIQKD